MVIPVTIEGRSSQ